MDRQIFLILLQDGLTVGAIYVLLAVSTVLVFSVTRIIFLPQGEFVAYGALALAALQTGQIPGLIWFLAGAGVLTAAVEVFRRRSALSGRAVLRILGVNIAYPAALAAVALSMNLAALPFAAQVLLALAIVVPLGPMIYALVYEPLAEASVLVLLILSVVVHFILLGSGLLIFGPEGSRTPPFTSQDIAIGDVLVTGQSLWIVGSCVLLVLSLQQFFRRTIYGKALRAAAMNRMGARLMGVSAAMAGRFAFFLAALIGALSGVLIGPIATIYYDTGFAIGLKGFVAAIIGGLANYPLAAAGAVLVAMIESFATFWASSFKDVIVFTLIIPVLLWLSLTTRHVEEEEDE